MVFKGQNLYKGGKIENEEEEEESWQEGDKMVEPMGRGETFG